MAALEVDADLLAAQRPAVAALGGEKTALGVGVGPAASSVHHHHHHGPPAPHFAVNGRPPPLLTSDALQVPAAAPGEKKDVKEWYV